MKKPKPPKAEHEHDRLICEKCSKVYLQGQEYVPNNWEGIKTQLDNWQKRCGEAEADNASLRIFSARYEQELSRLKADVDMARMDLKKQEEISTKYMNQVEELTDSRELWQEECNRVEGICFRHRDAKEALQKECSEKQNRIVTLESDIGALKQRVKPGWCPADKWLALIAGLLIGAIILFISYSQPKPVVVHQGSGAPDLTWDEAKTFILRDGGYVDQKLYTECHEYALKDDKKISSLQTDNRNLNEGLKACNERENRKDEIGGQR